MPWYYSISWHKRETVDIGRRFTSVKSYLKGKSYPEASIKCQALMMPPNGLRVSRAASIDRDELRAESNFQNATDLGAAKRRRLHALVSPQA